MQFMDLFSRYSTVQVVGPGNIKDAVAAFEGSLVSQFWYPESIHGYKAFQVEYKKLLDKLGIFIRPAPPVIHNKNSIESKH